MFLGDQFKFLKSIALKNPKGTIKAFGNWDGSGMCIDIIPDIKQSFAYLNNVPYIMMMSPKAYSDFVYIFLLITCIIWVHYLDVH